MKGKLVIRRYIWKKLLRNQCWEAKSSSNTFKKNKKAKHFQNWWKRLTHIATQQIPGKINERLFIPLWNYIIMKLQRINNAKTRILTMSRQNI